MRDVDVTMEAQPHGGALKRSHMTDEEDTYSPAPSLTDRQADRMAALPAIYKTPYERLACELTLGIDEPADIFSKYGLSEADGLLLLQAPAFTQVLDRVSQEVRVSGLSFKMKARLQAEELLGTTFQIATDPLQPTSERVKIAIWTTKMGGLEPSPIDEKGKNSGGGLNLSITFSGQAPMRVVSSEPQLIENGE